MNMNEETRRVEGVDVIFLDRELFFLLLSPSPSVFVNVQYSMYYVLFVLYVQRLACIENERERKLGKVEKV